MAAPCLDCRADQQQEENRKWSTTLVTVLDDVEAATGKDQELAAKVRRRAVRTTCVDAATSAARSTVQRLRAAAAPTEGHGVPRVGQCLET